jgi:hypothetical protein
MRRIVVSVITAAYLFPNALRAEVLKGITGPAREEIIFDTTTNPAGAALTRRCIHICATVRRVPRVPQQNRL